MSSAPSYAPFIVAPPFTSCQDSYLVFGQGTPPYRIYPIATGDKNGTSLETLPIQGQAGVFKWKVDFDAGANITWTLVDSNGAYAYSTFRVVQTGSVSHCPHDNTYSTPKSPLGAILGGVLGGLAGLAILAFLLLWYFRRDRFQFRSKRRGVDEIYSRSASPLPPPSPNSRGGGEMSERTGMGSRSNSTRTRDGAAAATATATTVGERDRDRDRGGGASAGTFNLSQVEFTEPSVEALRSMDAPPTYVAPLAHRTPTRERAEISEVAERRMEPGAGTAEGSGHGTTTTTTDTVVDVPTEGRTGESG
ncbi:hypothetical protein T439DRAFT_320522 [Meredithblackwellia eburnea MCA 4105]